MSTAGHPDALLRRIEQLAASSADEPEGAALAALVGAVRSEMSAVRADVSTVRAETAAVRADLDSLGGRLSGSLAAGRTETGELTRRVAELGSQVDGLGGGVEARLAVLEDVLDGLGERIEALARDGAGTTTEMLSSVLQGVRAVDRRVEQADARAAALEDRWLSRLGDVLAERDQALRAEVRAAVAEELAEVLSATARLEETVGGFRAEWPTRTYEVVEGAKAVAQGVVLDVREEVAARLEQVRAVLGSAVQGVEQARSGLDGGTDRLAQAGAVLVDYLEQRDRLLEAERDRVLHDVLDAFAAGLSARERGALAGRVHDAVSRRRDARDAERYRTAVGEPVAPTVALPDSVRDLVPPDADEARAQAPVEPAGTQAAEGAPGAEPAAGDGRDRPPPRTAVRTVAAVTRPAAARPAPGGSAVLPGPGKRVPAPGAAGAPGATVRRADRRGRLDAMPEVPSVAVALEAAAPPGPDAGSGEPDDEGGRSPATPSGT